MLGNTGRSGWGGVIRRTFPTVMERAGAARSDARSSGVANADSNNFAALRLAAALLVIYGHQAADATGTFGLRLVVFFSIGGFLIAGSWRSDPDARRFIVRRFLRIWPAYATVIVVCAALSYAFPAPDMPEVSRLASAFYLSNLWFSGFDWGFFAAHVPFMNQSLWMLRYEVDIYLAFAGIAMIAGRGLSLVALAFVIAALRAPETHPAPGGLLECWSLYFAGFFAFGVLLREQPVLRRVGFVLPCALVGTALLGWGQRTAGLLLVIPPVAVWVGERRWPLLTSAARYGDLSLGVFLWGWPVQQVTRLWLAPSAPLALQLAVVYGQVLVLAWLSWRFIEAPALRRKPLRSGRPRRGDEFLASS